MPKSKILSPAEAARVQTLDATTLGRPFHQLPLVMPLIEARMHDFVSRELSQRFRTHLTLSALHHTREVATSARWCWHRVGLSTIGSHIDRPLLLHILDCRYGGRGSSDSSDSQPQAETETEYRLARMLGATLAPLLPECIRQLGGDSTEDTTSVQHLPAAPNTPPAWALQLQLCGIGNTPGGCISLSLDRDSLDRLLKASSAFVAPRPAAAALAGAGFSDKLKIRLQARLLEKHTTLGEILDLQPGQILPASHPGFAHVHIGRSRLFSASVVEHDGKLCLTSFANEE
ncbi:FliM/FliN family flagellar motor C-terminal domain-containing protein [Craterilacuibacter sp.]|uniref:FliM/FliN family flagellar motor C-terminal domain-containing protein n=1 Tax=Craterilacuibacter sp. TaxID=2870909 RepID=UPI003F2EF988